jgi:hypothetical protein
LQEQLELAKETLTTEEIKNNLLLATDSDGKRIWQVTVDNGNLDVMQELWELGRENLTTEEIKVICY